MNFQPEDSDFNYSVDCNCKPLHPVLCSFATSKDHAGSVFIDILILPESGISAILHTKDLLNTIRAVPPRRSRPRREPGITRLY